MGLRGIKSFYNERQSRYHTLTEHDCESLLDAAFRLFETTGYQVKSPSARQLLLDAGAFVEGERVRIPQEIIAQSIGTAAKDVCFYDRNGKPAMHADGTNTFFGLGPTNPCVDDFYTGERRPAIRKDVAEAALVADACPNIDFLMGLAQITDCDLRMSDVIEGFEMMTNSTKPAFVWGINHHGLETQVKMADIIAGTHEKLVEKPFLGLFPGCPDTPLSINERVYENLEYAVRSGLPIIWMGGGQLGSSSPVTLAATVVVDLCDMLIGVILSQLLNPGSVVLVGFGIMTVDMKTMTSAYGSPEHCLGESMNADLMHYLGLPTIQTAGVTDSKLVDEQAAIETCMNVLVNVLAGGNFVHDIGFIDSAMSASLDQIVLSDEIIGYARRIGRGIDINEETLALDVINEVGPGGTFLTEEHTMENFRDQIWFPTLFEHSTYNKWITDRKDMRTRIHEKTAAILETHTPQPLPEKILEALKKQITQREAELGI